ncbi:hypothetical protein BJG93_23365 [Paraburkholderia sprentiae WSM5005]|uniref:Uncharacterized protein n=1 Tax=Paraburkholderia sprentiae WSM5005 TaxID=754502 RepID=A0A1I9YQ27_9BURK|nr:hypothetical protein [Paraburkholderia sprentiae]APA88318.1 hypothetical protein BJG93_23365 [Paraburkholderia sprentiae WSM5005]
MRRAFAIMLLSLPALCLAKSPPCDRYPTNVAEVALTNERLTDPAKIDHSKTRAVQLASEKIGKDEDGEQLWRQVYHITFYEKGGKEFKVITVGEAAWSECSMSAVEVFVVSRHSPPVHRLFKDIE